MSDPDRLAAMVVERTRLICAVPAPPGAEAERAALVAGWWTADGIADVRTDEVGNVWGLLRPGLPDHPCTLLAAHLDTVFPPSVPHGVRWAGDRLCGPSVGDNSVAVAAVAAVDSLLPSQLRHPLWLVATVGEEGLGNLRGIRAALTDPPAPVRAVIAVEGNYLGRVNVVGVGSSRFRVHVRCPGGHAWEDASTPSAVHVAAQLIVGLDSLAAPPSRTVNVGSVSGGRSVNARAATCEFSVDLRSDRPDALEELVTAARDVLRDGPPGVTIDVVETGARPAGRIAESHPLAEIAAAALSAAGIQPRFTAASTDANQAYAAGIPAVTVGVTTGEGTHSEDEWIDIPPLASGLSALAGTIIRVDAREW